MITGRKAVGLEKICYREMKASVGEGTEESWGGREGTCAKSKTKSFKGLRGWRVGDRDHCGETYMDVLVFVTYSI